MVVPVKSSAGSLGLPNNGHPCYIGTTNLTIWETRVVLEQMEADGRHEGASWRSLQPPRDCWEAHASCDQDGYLNSKTHQRVSVGQPLALPLRAPKRRHSGNGEDDDCPSAPAVRHQVCSGYLLISGDSTAHANRCLAPRLRTSQSLHDYSRSDVLAQLQHSATQHPYLDTSGLVRSVSNLSSCNSSIAAPAAAAYPAEPCPVFAARSRLQPRPALLSAARRSSPCSLPASRGSGCCYQLQPSSPCSAPASPGPCASPLGPGAEDWILSATRCLLLSPGATGRLALHLWRRTQGYVRLVASIRQPYADVVDPRDKAHTERLYAAACLWLAGEAATVLACNCSCSPLRVVQLGDSGLGCPCCLHHTSVRRNAKVCRTLYLP